MRLRHSRVNQRERCLTLVASRILHSENGMVIGLLGFGGAGKKKKKKSVDLVIAGLQKKIHTLAHLDLALGSIISASQENE